ncbi:MAG: hypothetical protein H7145_08840 [Akkermansiaceae bacterium]|nr:hypothetical protein [Armatimonadota bacterium]
MKKIIARPADLPALETARRELMTREARAFAWMLVRLVCVAFLITMLTRSAPGLQPLRILFDAVGGVLILAPLFTSLGQTFAWRIALGKAYLTEYRFDDADALLAVLSGLRAKLFDANGEGRYYRAVALRSSQRTTEADLIFREVAGQGREPWQEKARTELVMMGAGTKVGGTESAPTP